MKCNNCNYKANPAARHDAPYCDGGTCPECAKGTLIPPTPSQCVLSLVLAGLCGLLCWGAIAAAIWFIYRQLH